MAVSFVHFPGRDVHQALANRTPPQERKATVIVQALAVELADAASVVWCKACMFCTVQLCSEGDF